MSDPGPTFDAVFALSVFLFMGISASVSIGAYLRRSHDVPAVTGSPLLGPSVRGWYFENLDPVEELCVRWGVTPAMLSYLQLAGSVLVGGCYAAGMLFTGGWILLCAGTLDIVDGRVARRTHTGSPRGAFLDSVIDRYSDACAYIGLAVFFRASWVLWVVLLALVGGLMVSYTRARAEGLGVQCHVGLLQRPERYVILGLGTIFGSLLEQLTGPWPAGQHFALVVFAIIALAILTNVSALQRAAHVWRLLGEQSRG